MQMDSESLPPFVYSFNFPNLSFELGSEDLELTPSWAMFLIEFTLYKDSSNTATFWTYVYFEIYSFSSYYDYSDYYDYELSYNETNNGTSKSTASDKGKGSNKDGSLSKEDPFYLL